MEVKKAIENVEAALRGLSGPTGEAFLVLFESLGEIKARMKALEEENKELTERIDVLVDMETPGK